MSMVFVRERSMIVRGGRYEVEKVAGGYGVQVSDTTMSIDGMWLVTTKKNNHIRCLNQQ